MKKIVMANGEIRFEGESGVNSVCLRATRIFGPIAIGTAGCVASVNDEGTIDCRSGLIPSREQYTLYKKMYEMQIKDRKMFLLLTILSFALLIPISTVSQYAGNLVISLVLFFSACLNSSGAVSLFLEKIKGNKEIISLLKFHSAEHAAVNAYYDLHRIPTLEEIKQYSNFAYDCGSLQGIPVITALIGVAIARLIPNNFLYFICAMAMIVITILLSHFNKLYFMEFLVTDTPSDREYEVAIVALKQSIKEVEHIHVSIGDEIDEVGTIHGFSDELCLDCPDYDLCKSMNLEEHSFEEKK